MLIGQLCPKMVISYIDCEIVTNVIDDESQVACSNVSLVWVEISVDHNFPAPHNITTAHNILLLLVFPG